MDVKGYCKLCGKIHVLFCCKPCYEQDATKSNSKADMGKQIRELREALKAIIDGIDAERYGDDSIWDDISEPVATARQLIIRYNFEE